MSAATDVLPAEDLAVLRFAGEWWKDAAAREQAIRDRFGITPVRFYQRVAHLMRTPAAQQAEPVLCARLQRIRSARGRLRGRSTVMSVTR